MMNKNIIVFEHSMLSCCDEKCEQCQHRKNFVTKDNSCYCILHCPKKYFEELKDYCLKPENKNCGFAYHYHNKGIIFSKYTGILQCSDGTYIEILPKTGKTTSIIKGRKVFENLILSAHNLTKEYKQHENIRSSVKKNSLIEIYISLFCHDLLTILKKGIKRTYIKQQGNINTYKGKIKFNEHIKYNQVCKHKFFVEYNDFSMDIPENRILKSACLVLLKKTTNPENKKILLKFLLEFENISCSNNLFSDFQTVSINRLHSYYARPIQYAEFFLKNEMFFPKHGKAKLLSLLFPLNEMFEDYLEKVFMKLPDMKVKKQFSKYSLIKTKEKFLFQTKMDFFLTYEQKKIVLDAKWKLIDFSKENYEVAQADLYQLFTYSEIIQNKEVQNINQQILIVLCYPKTDLFQEKVRWEFFNGKQVLLVPIDVSLKSYEQVEYIQQMFI